MTPDHRSLIVTPAYELVDALRTGDITPLDLLDALEKRVAETDVAVNALPTLCFERAREQALTLMRRPPSERGLLSGMPVAIKDLVAVEGVRFTRGSTLYAETIAERSDVMVENLEAQGAIIYAKSNTSEFGASAHTVNDVFGVTRNPWDLSRSVSGSSGGAAAALASAAAWLAHGSDSAGSLRNPASFCGVVGMRPSLNRVAHTPIGKVDRNLVAHGPMARNVQDLALLLDAMCGEFSRDPRSTPSPATSFLNAARTATTPKRVAYSSSLGITPVDPEVVAITRAAALRLAKTGVVVEEVHPDLTDAHACFRILAGVDFGASNGWMLRDRRIRERMHPDLAHRIEQTLTISTASIERAEAQRLRMTQNMQEFFGQYDLLLTPATIVAPFPIDNGPLRDGGLSECEGVSFKRPFEWLAIAYAITLVCCPALSLPCGFTRGGLPVGLQMITPPRTDARLLSYAYRLEQVLGLQGTTPIDPRRASTSVSSGQSVSLVSIGSNE